MNERRLAQLREKAVDEGLTREESLELAHAVTPEAEDEPAMLHVYGSGGPHQDVYIVGNTAGLMRLSLAVGNALSTLEKGDAEVMPNDGEGYDVLVERDDTHWQSASWQARGDHYCGLGYCKVDRK